jgi:hypothetical protein
MKQLFTFLGLLVAFSLHAQQRPVNFKSEQHQPAIAHKIEPNPGIFSESVPAPTQHSGLNYRADGPEELIAPTYWDAQSYGCMSSHLYANQNGEPVGYWIFTNQVSGQSDRGTGRSVRTAGAWSVPTTRVEAVRTGFPAAVMLGDGTEVIISHNTSVTPFKIWMARKAPGASTWTETALPQPAGIRMLWPKVAVGGPNNQTLHVIAITAPTGTSTGGVVYQGLNGHILYYRSTDGGLTWDQQNVIIPGLDSSRFVGFSADSYTIDATGNTVAIGVFPDWNDVRVFKSTDNGNNWNNLQVLDFPDAIENYVPLPGNSYTVDDVPLDTLAPTSSMGLATRTNDGFGSLLIDQSGQIHTWFGRMYVVDTDFSDSLSGYYPTVNGIFYWKESRGANNLDIITGALDYDGDGGATDGNNSNIVAYGGASISSFPSAGIDAQGDLYLVYSAINELCRVEPDAGQYFRHNYIIRSNDGGDTWSFPYEITAEPYVDPFLAPFTEAVWPALPRNIGSSVWVLYQADYLPGSTIFGNAHAATEAFITWVDISKDSLMQGISSVLTPSQPDFEVAVVPNPAQDFVQVLAKVNDAADVLVEVFDFSGRKVSTQNFAAGSALRLPVGQLANGVYQVRVIQNGRFGAVRLVKG